MELLTGLWLGMPVWVWLAFLGAVLAILVFDLGVLHREAHEIEVKESLWMSALYIGLGLLWAVAVWFIYYEYGSEKAIDPQIANLPTSEAKAWEAVKLYLTGYLVEKALAMDNVFVISMIFTYFAVPRIHQHRVLFWGILGVIVLRAIMIGLGAALVMNFAWMLYLFAVVLVATGVKMLMSIDDEPDIANNRILKFIKGRMRVTETLHGERFFVKQADAGGKLLWFATPLFLCLVLVELADVVFAIDSVPAIFAITPDPFIVYTSNIFAILGLRALYFALAAMVHRFHYLKYALALVLVFIGGKILIADFVLGGAKFPPLLSLAVTLALIAGGVVWSLWKTRGDEAPRLPQ